eukprot:5450253-Amphidinium_carterae.1
MLAKRSSANSRKDASRSLSSLRVEASRLTATRKSKATPSDAPPQDSDRRRLALSLALLMVDVKDFSAFSAEIEHARSSDRLPQWTELP